MFVNKLLYTELLLSHRSNKSVIRLTCMYFPTSGSNKIHGQMCAYYCTPRHAFLCLLKLSRPHVSSASQCACA